MKRMFLYALCTVFALQSCDKGEETPPPAKPSIKLSSTVLNCPAQAKDTSITVTAVGEWKVGTFTTVGEWCTTTPAGNELKITLTKNEGTETRTVKMTLSAGTAKAELTVNQAGQAAPVVAPDDLANLAATPGKGEVTLSWDEPTGVAYAYVELKYNHPRTGQKTVKINHPATSFTVTDLLNKDGQYTFTLQPYGANDVAGKLETIKATCEKVDATTIDRTVKVELTVEMVSTNAQEPSEGPIENLVDGDLDTYFHSFWDFEHPDWGDHNFSKGPHWIDIQLPEALETLEFTTWNRRGKLSANTPKAVSIWVSTDGTNYTQIGDQLEWDEDDEEKYVSPKIDLGGTYQYIRYQCDKSMEYYYDQYDGRAFTLAEMEIRKIVTELYDPENE